LTQLDLSTSLLLTRPRPHTRLTFGLYQELALISLRTLFLNYLFLGWLLIRGIECQFKVKTDWVVVTSIVLIVDFGAFNFYIPLTLGVVLETTLTGHEVVQSPALVLRFSSYTLVKVAVFYLAGVKVPEGVDKAIL